MEESQKSDILANIWRRHPSQNGHVNFSKICHDAAMAHI
jgi:hypothetical protein